MAIRGGAVFLKNTQFRIETCTFISNSAESGGALVADIKAIHMNIVGNSVFMWNSATVEGGAIKWLNAEVRLLNVSFSANSAYYGANVASYGISLSSRLTHLVGNEVPGAPISLVLELLDHYGAVVTTATEKYAQLVNTSAVDFLGTKVRFIKQGVIDFSPLTVFAQPGRTQDITVQMEDKEGDFHLVLQAIIKIPFRNCTAGEVYHPSLCEWCPPGYFSFSPSDPSCLHCPSHAFCAGGSSVSVDAQYWRNASDSADILTCPLGDNCRGGPNSTCADGFTGPLCNLCASGYYRFRSAECGQCTHWALLGLKLLAVLALLLLFLYGTVRFTLSQPNNNKLFLLKTLISHAQYLTALAFLRVSFPSPITYTLHAVSFLSSLLITNLPLACLGVTTPEYTRAIVGSLVPVLLGAALVLRKSGLVAIGAAVMFTPVVAVYTALPLFICFPVNSRELLFADMREECWTSTHLTYIYALAVPSLVLNTLVPLLAVGLCMKRRQLTIWRSGYNFLLWDLFLLVARVVYAGVLISSQMSFKLIQLCYGLTVLICTCIVNVAVQPWVYHHKHLFFLSETSLAIVSISQGLTVYYIYSPPGSGWQDYALSTVFVGLNGGYMMVIAYFLLSKVQITPEFQDHRDIEGNRVPCNSLNSSISFQQ